MQHKYLVQWITSIGAIAVKFLYSKVYHLSHNTCASLNRYDSAELVTWAAISEQGS